MTDRSLAPRRLASRRVLRPRMQSRRIRPQIEGLEDRIVPSYFPSTADGIGVFEDQLPDGLSAAMTQFVATHTDGTQKELLGQTEQFRAINPNFTVLQYQLGTGNSAVRLHHRRPVGERLELRQPAGELVRPPELFRRTAIRRPT